MLGPPEARTGLGCHGKKNSYPLPVVCGRTQRGSRGISVSSVTLGLVSLTFWWPEECFYAEAVTLHLECQTVCQDPWDDSQAVESALL